MATSLLDLSHFWLSGLIFFPSETPYTQLWATPGNIEYQGWRLMACLGDGSYLVCPGSLY